MYNFFLKKVNDQRTLLEDFYNSNLFPEPTCPSKKQRLMFGPFGASKGKLDFP